MWERAKCYPSLPPPTPTELNPCTVRPLSDERLDDVIVADVIGDVAAAAAAGHGRHGLVLAVERASAAADRRARASCGTPL